MKVSIVGTGYVGLVSGVCLAEKGHDVMCVDRDESKVVAVNDGQPPIYEEGLGELLSRNVGSKIAATTDLEAAVLDSELTIIAVGTPFVGREIDLGYVRQAAIDIGAALRSKSDYHMVVVKSTVVPGTTDNLVGPELEESSGKKLGIDFGIGMNPEFLREGVAVSDFMDPDRIVYGADSEKALQMLDELYSVFPDADKIRTTAKTAEMIKYTANSLLATLISFSNEIGNLCASVKDIDVEDVMRGVHLDKRFCPILDSGERIVPAMTTFLKAGCGFGGSCFPKDISALVAFGQSAGLDMSLLESVLNINAKQPERLIALLTDRLDPLEGRSILVLGLAFKAGTDDMRESPAIPVVTRLHELGAVVSVYDPIAVSNARTVFDGLSLNYRESWQEALADVDAIVLVTHWPEFEALPAELDKLEDPPLLVDGRRFLDKATITNFAGIGVS